MSEESQVPSGEPSREPSGPTGDQNSKTNDPSGTMDKKGLEQSYMKTLAQEKSLRERVKTLEMEKAEVERQKLEAEGKKDELIQHLKKENAEIKEREVKAEAAKAHEKISSQVANKALQMGCVDPELVKELVSHSSLDVDQSYRVGEDSLSLALDRLRQQKPYLFQGKKAAVIDAPPASPQAAGVANPTSIGDMSVEQMEALYRKKFGGATQ